MGKPNRLWLVSVFIIFVTIVGAWTMQVQAIEVGSNDVTEQKKIKDVIHTYFEMRYRSHKALQLEGFEALIIDSPKGISLLHSEMDKLEIELHHAKLNGLKYVEYDYFLNFKDISWDTKTETATALVIEGHDVQFELSRKLSMEKPIISSMRNLQHLIFLRKEGETWKIVSDEYNDYLWRLLKTTGLTKEEYFTYSEESRIITTGEEAYLAPTYSCNLQDDDSSYDYNRDGAIEYAHEWALGRNPDYHDFTYSGGDCQNFVSQAIYEGGGALMASDGRPTYGWYYNSNTDYASAWTGVYSFYDFVVPGYLVWNTGTEGCLLDQGLYQAMEGDVVQYDWTKYGSWDHSVIIVQSIIGPPDWNHLVASHGIEDHDNYPFTYFDYEYPNMVYRFIRIERLDGNRVHLSLILDNGIATKMQNPLMGPYPALLESGVSTAPSPYPLPSIYVDTYSVPYPAP